MSAAACRYCSAPLPSDAVCVRAECWARASAEAFGPEEAKTSLAWRVLSAALASHPCGTDLADRIAEGLSAGAPAPAPEQTRTVGPPLAGRAKVGILGYRKTGRGRRAAKRPIPMYVFKVSWGTGTEARRMWFTADRLEAYDFVADTALDLARQARVFLGLSSFLVRPW